MRLIDIRRLMALVLILVVALSCYLLWLGGNNETTSPAEDSVSIKTDRIRVDSPLPNDVVESPFIITGEARGFWFFEGDFPVRLVDEDGITIGTAIAQARGEWMTEDFVAFQATMEYEPPTAETGILVLEKDNPSGLPEHDDELRFSVRFR